METPPVSIALEQLGVPHTIFRHDEHAMIRQWMRVHFPHRAHRHELEIDHISRSGIHAPLQKRHVSFQSQRSIENRCIHARQTIA